MIIMHPVTLLSHQPEQLIDLLISTAVRRQDLRHLNHQFKDGINDKETFTDLSFIKMEMLYKAR